MLDFSSLKAPGGDGEALVLPAPKEWVRAVESNARRLRSADRLILGSSLASWRRTTREKICGGDERPIIVVGHQPSFIHPGVWAKQVVARCFAEAIDGAAVNLVVDNDAPRTTALTVPVQDAGGLRRTTTPFGDLSLGWAYEQMLALSHDQIAGFENAIKSVCGERFDRSLLPAFLAGLRSAEALAGPAQMQAGRRAIDAALDADVDARPVSALWWTPFLADLLAGAVRFADSYNRALAEYRRAMRVRGSHRPIPDLQRRGELQELPLWALRLGEPRRRVFVRSGDKYVTLFAESAEMGRVNPADMDELDRWIAPLGDDSAWRLRPRALALTIWARLFLADLFIHGIGGAKYDRISDAIMADFYGIEPPRMACVSATLFLDLPRTAVGDDSRRALQHTLRDLRWNPQRYMVVDSRLAGIVAERETAVREGANLRAAQPGDREGRKRAFERIRSASRLMAAAVEHTSDAKRRELDRVGIELQQNHLAMDREYFYGLYTESNLERLLGALPDRGEFRV